MKQIGNNNLSVLFAIAALPIMSRGVPLYAIWLKPMSHLDAVVTPELNSEFGGARWSNEA